MLKCAFETSLVSLPGTTFKVKVVPVVVGALGTIPKALEKHLKEIGTSVRVELLQKAALLGTARILRKTLEI